MTHKIINLKKGFAYTGTIVHFERSLAQIQKMLLKYNCEKIAILTDNTTKDEFILHTIAFQRLGIPYLIEFPVTYIESPGGKTRILNMDVSGRIIHDRIKSLLIDVEIGYLDFSQAMMAFIAIPGPDQKPVSLVEYMSEHLDQVKGGAFEFKYLPPPGSN